MFIKIWQADLTQKSAKPDRREKIRGNTGADEGVHDGH